MRAWLLVLVLSVGCDGSADPDAGSSDGGVADGGATAADAGDEDAGPSGVDAGVPGADCLEFEPPTEVGEVPDADLNELSGIAASRAHAGALYVHNDSGDGPRIYVLSELDASVRGTVELAGAGARDYEDIAVGPGADGEPWVFVGDTGDNAARTGGTGRSSVFVYRFPEAALDASAPFGTVTVTPEVIEITYPDAPHDCESVAVGPDGDLYLLTKEDSGPSTLFVARAPFETGLVLEPVVTLDIGGATIPGSRQATAMDLSPGGRGLLLRTYNRVYLFTRDAAEVWADALLRAPTRLRAAREIQGEAIAWRADGRAYLTISEMVGPPLSVYAASSPGCSPL